jgi:hypothetical protein
VVAQLYKPILTNLIHPFPVAAAFNLFWVRFKAPESTLLNAELFQP